VLKKITAVLYSAAVVMALRHVVNKITKGRTDYIRRRASSTAAVKVFIRMLVIGGGEAYLLSERSIYIHIVPKIPGHKVVIGENERLNAKNFVEARFVRLFQTHFGYGKCSCCISTYTSSADDDSRMIATTLKFMHLDKYKLYAKYPDLKAPVEEYIRWFESETLAEPIRISSV
jgi:hypothetical protein